MPCPDAQPCPTGQLGGPRVPWPRSADPALRERRGAVITGVTEIAHITTKQDMSRWTRAHADAPGINWSVFAGPGGTMIIVEPGEARCSFARPRPAPDIAGPADSAMTRRADGAA